jgi:glutamate synthase domain-containing protein 3
MNIEAGLKYYKDLNIEINNAFETTNEVILDDVNGQRYIGCGLGDNRKIIINGTPGNDLAAYIDGGSIEVFGNGQEAAGNTMNRGRIVIHGSVGDALGYAMRGGEIYIEGNVGFRCGIHMKEFGEAKPTIVIGGSAGSFLGEYMAGGRIILLGINADEKKGIMGDYCGTGMHGGMMYIRGDFKTENLSREIFSEECDENDYIEIEKYVKIYCECFDYNYRNILDSKFTKLRAASKRPYGNMYTAN